MNKQNTQKLLGDFPMLYREPGDTLMQWGFSCRDGWFDLVYRLSADIEAAARAAGLSALSADWPRAVQVKEKFGTLRFYLRTGVPDARMRDLIQAAASQSARTCEACGAPGELKTEGWWHVTCPACEGIRKTQPKEMK